MNRDFNRLTVHAPATVDTLIDFMPPVSRVFLTKAEREAGLTHDQKYQQIFDDMSEANDDIVNYGEGFEAVAQHCLDMTGAERQLFEDCNQGSGAFQRPGLNVPSIPYGNKFELLARRLNCTLDQAADLVDFWSIIDDSARLWGKFESGMREKIKSGKTTLEDAIRYFETLAGELVLVVDERSLDPFNVVDGELSLDFDSEIDAAAPDTDIAELERCFGRIGWVTETGTFHHDKGFSSPSEYAYQELEDSPSAAPVWTANAVCPHLHEYVTLIASTKKAKLAEVSKARRMAAKGEWFAWMNKPQRKEWWQAANKRQTECLQLREEFREKIAKSLTPQESKILQQIEAVKSKAQARYFWANLYQAKDGKIPGIRPAVAEHFMMDRLDRAQQAFK